MKLEPKPRKQDSQEKGNDAKQREENLAASSGDRDQAGCAEEARGPAPGALSPSVWVCMCHREGEGLRVSCVTTAVTAITWVVRLQLSKLGLVRALTGSLAPTFLG